MTSLTTTQTTSFGLTTWQTVRSLSLLCALLPACVQAPVTDDGPDLDIDTDDQQDIDEDDEEQSQRPPSAEAFEA